MTEQEQQLIAGLADRIRNAPAPQIDRDADDLIRRTISTPPDALYILTQTVLIQEMALNQAKAQIEQLKQPGAPAPQPRAASCTGSRRPTPHTKIRVTRRPRRHLHRVVGFRVLCTTLRPLRLA